MRPALRAVYIIARASTDLNGLVTDFENLADKHSDWHVPLLVLPVVGGLGLDGEAGR